MAMLRFVDSDSAGLPLKRRQVTQACAACRRRKVGCCRFSISLLDRIIDYVTQKRCVHAKVGHDSGADVAEGLSQRHGRHHHVTVNSDKQSSGSCFRKNDASLNQERHVSRFVGDMNPEGIFIEATSPHSSRDRSIQGGVGVWQSQASDKPYPSSSPTKQTSTVRQTIQDLFRSHVQVSCLPCRPAATEYAALSRIYHDKLDPLFPAVSRYLTQPPDDEITRIVLQQVVSLAAASDPEAAPHLRLQNQDKLLGRSEFSAHLSCAIRVTLDAGFITDRYALTRILLVFSLYMQPTCPEEADLPARAFADATHQMHTLGLHLAADENKEGSQSIRSLFCCMWALDRINSSLYGRALLIHERDIGWDLDAGIAAQDPSFRLFLMIVGLLDKVIDLYRPKNMNLQESVVVELPILEQMIIDAGATKVSSAILGKSCASQVYTTHTR